MKCGIETHNKYCYKCFIEKFGNSGENRIVKIVKMEMGDKKIDFVRNPAIMTDRDVWIKPSETFSLTIETPKKLPKDSQIVISGIDEDGEFSIPLKLKKVKK